MRIFEVNNFLISINNLLLESFKQDMYHQYPEAKDDEKFNNAIKVFNDNQKIKDAVKKKISLNGNIAKSIKNAYPLADDFVNFINTVVSELTTKEQEKEEYNQLKQGTISAGETDYWMIPCHTFKEAHEAAFKYVGNLPRLTKEEITNKYGIETPEPANFYKTDKTPEEFLEFMKNEDNFFMAPTWCIAANKNYFDDYKLETSEDEKPLCYVFVSKKYPNVRFCITLKEKDVEKIIDNENEKMKITYDVDLNEVRDPWQIGGGDNLKGTGLKMMRLAFGDRINKVIEDICSLKTKITPFSKLKNGERVFYEFTDIPYISASFDSLINGCEMFGKSKFEKVNCKFPVLENGSNMFCHCKKLYEFMGDLPKLLSGYHMFSRCFNLKNFECENLPELKYGEYMFEVCGSLKKFECNLPKLKIGNCMFLHCGNLESFSCDLSSLEKSDGMFMSSGIKTFKSNLSNLTSANSMFAWCENLKSFNSKLSVLTRAKNMFQECGLLEFENDMPKLFDGEGMFRGNKNLKSFNCKLPYLFIGTKMFSGCENLTSFRSDLSSLFEGEDMFKGCKLDTESVKNIAETISTARKESITIGVDEMDEEKEKYIKMIEEKGWKVEIE